MKPSGINKWVPRVNRNHCCHSDKHQPGVVTLPTQAHEAGSLNTLTQKDPTFGFLIITHVSDHDTETVVVTITLSVLYADWLNPLKPRYISFFSNQLQVKKIKRTATNRTCTIRGTSRGNHAHVFIMTERCRRPTGRQCFARTSSSKVYVDICTDLTIFMIQSHRKKSQNWKRKGKAIIRTKK